MPERFDDAVVGAGVIGLAHAYHLARRGRRVIVFERHARACSASVRNFGMLWPIGQPAGPLHQLASRSLVIWGELLAESGLWHDPCGSLHLAYHDDEWQILHEFGERAGEAHSKITLLSPEEVRRKAPAVRDSGLQGGMFSPVETCIDPRQVIAELPAFLNQRFNVQFRFGHLVTGYEGDRVHAQGSHWSADRCWVCSGEELQLLYPEVHQRMELRRCKLQMMRSQAYGTSLRIGPMLAAGLTLRHYASFAECPSLPRLKERIARESPEFDRFGIHVMTSQNGQGEIILGDSHEYDLADREPFNSDEIDRLILEYLHRFVDLPELRIAARWYGVYAKHATKPYQVVRPAANVTVINGVGGNGMTFSFGLAEQVVHEILGEA